MTENGNKNPKLIHIWNLKINLLNYSEILNEIISSVKNKKKLSITYANSNTLNKVYKDISTAEKINSFDIIHPDGVGVYFSTRFLFKENIDFKRITGSDLYLLLVNECTRHNFKVFFFGHRLKTLNKIHSHIPDLNICGIQEGYDFDNSSLLKSIQSAHPDVLIVGLGQFKQEEWILSNKDKIDVPVILAVGDGIKVFAGTKIRGPVFARKMGLEWSFRLLRNPFKYWFRYTIGNSLFLMRIIKSKMTKFSNS